MAEASKPETGAATQTTAVAKKQTAFDQEMALYEPHIAAVLPNHIKIERFRRVVVTAVNQNPDLLQADRRSLFVSCVQSANDGLLPDGKEAALVIYNVKDRGEGGWKKVVRYMPMIAGIRKRMRNTGEVTFADAQVVYSGDTFDYELGDNPHITHKPTLGDRGAPIGAYAIIKLANGEILREVMTTAEIEKVRAVSKAKDAGPWVDWWGEMARKSCLRRCSKGAPTSAEIDELWDRHEPEDGGTVAAALPAPVPQVTHQVAVPSRLEAFEARVTETAEQPDGSAAPIEGAAT